MTSKALVMGKAKPQKAALPSSADAPAQEIVQQNIDSAQQLIKINRYANKMIDQLMAWQEGDSVAIQILESQERKIRIRGTKKRVTTYPFKDPRELCIRPMGKIREQIDLQIKIFSPLYDMEAFKQFKEAFLETIGKVSPELTEQIIAHLQKDRLLPTGF